MEVNFITEITSFHRFVKTTHFSNNAQLLWFKMFLLWNETGFPDWLQVDNLRLMAMIQVNSKNALFRARSELLEAGLIIYQRGGNCHPNKYQFNIFGKQPLGSSPKLLKEEPATEPEREPLAEPETEPLYKQNKTKPNYKKEKITHGDFSNVSLTGVELKKLQRNYPDTWEDWIRRLDLGKAVKDYSYTNDYAAILSWIDKEEREERDKAFQELMDEII